MTTTLDKYGRIVIPKKLQKKLGIIPGSRLHLEYSDREIHITPVSNEPQINNVNGWLTVSGKVNGDISDCIEKTRAERNRYLSELSS
jgi:AbrB family looped-hinge helix DNA binding protein